MSLSRGSGTINQSLPAPLRGGGGGGGQRILNLMKHTVQILDHIVIPEPQYTITFCLDLFRSRLVSHPPHVVLATIKLNNKLCPATDKIDNERANQSLPPEVRAGQRNVVTKALP